LYPGAREVVLTDNHRSTQQVLDASARLISYNNPYRLEAVAGIDKRLRSQRPPGSPVRHIAFDTASAEADGVAALIEERLAAGLRPRDVAILVRSNDDADAFQRALNVKGIPHRFTGSRGLYAREEVRLLVAFLRALANPDDSISVFYLAASELYGVPETELLRLNQYARRKSRPLLEVLRGLPANEDLAGIGAASRGLAARLVSDLALASADVPRLRTGEVLYKFLQSSGLLGRLSREATAASESRVKNIAKFFDTVKAYGDVAEHDRVPAFVAHLDLLREAGDDPAVAEADLRRGCGPRPHGLHKGERPSSSRSCSSWPAPKASSRLQRPRRAAGPSPAELLKESPFPRGLAHPGRAGASSTSRLTGPRTSSSSPRRRITGTRGRVRKLSRFVVDALDLPSPVPSQDQPGPRGPGPQPAGRGQPSARRSSDGDNEVPCVSRSATSTTTHLPHKYR
jgi:hypothetical protein